jgi:hypothetical protein
MIGGIIVLALFLTALTAMVVVSQQYDTYQNTADKMSQKDIDRFSENLTAIYPGLRGPMDPYLPPLSDCVSNMCQYDLFLSNLGGVAIQIAQIYINSTEYGAPYSGCDIPNSNVAGPCLFTGSQTVASYRFNTNDNYLNAGEFNHTVRIWLPSTVVLPNPGPSNPANTIWIVTTRGRTFSFQWPFAANPVAVPGFTPNLIRGNTKVAYWSSTGSNKYYYSQYESPDGVTPPDTSNGGTCHMEGYQPIHGQYLPGPLPAGTTGRHGETLPSRFYFVNPWVIPDIVHKAAKSGNLDGLSFDQSIFVYARLNNTSNNALTITAGNVILETAFSDSNMKVYFLGGYFIGAIYPVTSATFSKSATIAPISKPGPGDDNGTFIAIFELDAYDQALWSAAPPDGLMFMGTGALNNQARDGTYTSMMFFMDGIYIRSCGAGWTTPPGGLS